MKTQLRNIALIVLALTVVLAGCSSRSQGVSDSFESNAYEMEKGVMQESPAAEPMAGNSDADMNDEAYDTGSGVLASDMPRMIIYNASLDLVVLDTDATELDVIALAESMGGYISGSSSYNYGEGLRSINITVRIPAEKFQETMAALREMAVEVRSDSISSSDVTQEYVDLESRLSALEVKAARLEELMDAAEDTEAVLEVYRELSSTQQEIEQVKGRMRYLERLSAMATIEVHLEPDALAQPVELPGWNPQGTAKRAIESLVNALQGLADFAITFVLAVLPILIIIGVVIFGIIKLLGLIFGKSRRRRKAEREARKAMAAQVATDQASTE